MGKSASKIPPTVTVGGFEFDVGPQYIPLNLLGKGAFGKVISAIDDLIPGPIRTEVAIKKVALHHGFKARHMKAITRELLMLSKFQHPNIMDVLKIIIKPTPLLMEDIYIVQTLMHTDLNKVIVAQKKLPSEISRSIFYQILCGIKYIHSVGVIHRDMKPDNIFMQLPNHTIKIGDFGWARGALPQNVKLTMKVGTKAYMAPEQMAARGKYSNLVDVWGTGRVMLELLYLNYWFAGSDEVSILTQILEILGTPDPSDLIWLEDNSMKKWILSMPHQEKIPWFELLPGEDPLVVDLIDKMLTFNPYKRIAVENALAHPYFESIRRSEAEKVGTAELTFENELIEPTMRDMTNMILEVSKSLM